MASKKSTQALATWENVAQSVTFHDYHRTVIAYHGTTTDVAARLVNGEPFTPSDNDDDWFGNGIYFWEYAPKQAWWWTERFKKKQNPAVVGAIIRLGHCLDLLDPENVRGLQKFKADAIAKWPAGVPMPQNGNQHKNFDCAIFNMFYDLPTVPKIETARAVYVPTASNRRAWLRSWIHEESHIQICVRKPENILAVWPVRKDGHYGRD